MAMVFLLKITLFLHLELKKFHCGGSGTSVSNLSRLILLTNNKPFYSVVIQFELSHFKGCLHLAWLSPQFKSSHQRCSREIDVLKNFTTFTETYMCLSFFFNKVAGLRPATLLKKKLWHRCFPVNFVKFLRTRFLQNISWRRMLLSFATLDEFLRILFFNSF